MSMLMTILVLNLAPILMTELSVQLSVELILMIELVWTLALMVELILMVGVGVDIIVNGGTDSNN